MVVIRSPILLLLVEIRMLHRMNITISFRFQQTNEFTTVTYFWSRVAGSVIISDQEEDENRGESAIFKLMKAKMDVLEESIKEQFSSYLYAAGGGTDPLDLHLLFLMIPLQVHLVVSTVQLKRSGVLSSYAFAGALNATNIEEAFDDILLDLTLKSDKPDLILVGRNIYRLYRAAVRDKITFALSDTAVTVSA
jgi:hypothetical protein